jgi:hypothetical protein
MNNLLIIGLLISSVSWAAPAKPPVKTPTKALHKVTVKLSTTYLQSYPEASILVRAQPPSLNQGKKIISAQCLKNTLSCDIFMDAQNQKLLNISVRGPKLKIQKLLTWLKTNSQTYQETQPPKK